MQLITQLLLPPWLQSWVDVSGRTELNKLVGQKILYAFDDEHYGWYIGIITTNPGARDLKQTPRANCNVSYRKKAMKGRELPKYPPTDRTDTGRERGQSIEGGRRESGRFPHCVCRIKRLCMFRGLRQHT